LVKTLKAETSGQVEIPLGERVFTCAGAPTASKSLWAAAMPFSTTRPDRCRPKSRCASAFRLSYARSRDPARRRISRYRRRCLGE
jgi:hypothetical protein